MADIPSRIAAPSECVRKAATVMMRMLATHQRLTSADVAAECDCAFPTIHRAVAALREAGAVLEFTRPDLVWTWVNRAWEMPDRLKSRSALLEDVDRLRREVKDLRDRMDKVTP